MRQGFDEEMYHRVEEYRELGVFSPAERLAAEAAERFHADHEAMMADEAFWERMRTEFTDAQILELFILIGYCIGVGRTLAVLDIANDCELSFTRDPVDSAALPVVEP